MTTEALSVALDRMIDHAGGFDRREPRKAAVLVRFTQNERDLLDRVAADKGIKRDDLIRRLLSAGLQIESGRTAGGPLEEVVRLLERINGKHYESASYARTQARAALRILRDGGAA